MAIFGHSSLFWWPRSPTQSRRGQDVFLDPWQWEIPGAHSSRGMGRELSH